MIRKLQNIIQNPKQMFLLDAFGALVTAVSLLGLLYYFEEYFGMPKPVLLVLGFTACLFFIYSMECTLSLRSHWKPYIAFIIICNSIYAIVSLSLLFIHSDKLTSLGYLYFVLELIVLAFVIWLEVKTYKQATS